MLPSAVPQVKVEKSTGAMPLSPGTRLGPYDVVALIGARRGNLPT
jgi:hypothetical protein